MKYPPLSLYVHLPWCVRKCPYCDFNSHSAGEGAPVERYVNALLKDLEREAQRTGSRTIETVFLGGGTPSLFPPEEVHRLLKGATALFDITETAEVTMEANPGTVEFGSPAGYREAGVNRLSIGAQSFDDYALRRLGRIHSSDDIRTVVEQIRIAGFDNFNLDLMHGLPGQTLETAAADVRAAIELRPTHLSWYQLTLEPNTVFYACPPEDLPDEESAYEIQDAGGALLREAGFEQYEVSAWATDKSRRCLHNLNYWQFGDYLGVGAGAHGKFSDEQGVRRNRKPANPLQYMLAMEQDADTGQPDSVTGDDLVFEFMLNALRLNDGFPETAFVERTGLQAGALASAASGAIDKRLIVRRDDATWAPTELGRRFLNDLQAEFLRNK